MKKLGLFAMAFALLMGMSQCKKENTNTSADESAKVPITLNVNGGNGSRVAVNTENGVVTFENGDVLYVASGGVYVGTLTYNGTVFSGNVTEPTEGQKLQFYFFGNVNPEETMTEGSTTGCSVVISDQTEHLPVISYAPSRENYQVGLTAYNATLLNKCALVKFDVTSASEAATCIVGMNNKVTVDFTDNSFAYGQDGEGIITLAAGNGERWAILLPQDEVTHVNAYSTDGIYVGSCASIPTIMENSYLVNGIAIAISLPCGVIDGLFTVNANGQQVYFSQGNLQYQASTETWHFAPNQYDYIGEGNANISQTYNGWIDLFGWGTSGYNHGAECYQPWSTNRNDNKYYAYGSYQYNLFDQTGQADWGYNAISNGGNTENSGWRTMTSNEWNCVLNTRTTTSGIRYAMGNVNGINGTILLPDNWTASVYALNGTNGNNNEGYTSNIISSVDWTNILEVNGAVFLPASGFRTGTSINNYGGVGEYYSSSCGPNQWNGVVRVQFDAFSAGTYWTSRDPGYAVRLVRDVE